MKQSPYHVKETLRRVFQSLRNETLHVFQRLHSVKFITQHKIPIEQKSNIPKNHGIKYSKYN